MFAWDLDRWFLQALNTMMCVALLASVLSLVGLLGSRWIRSAAHRHFWLLTTLCVILILPLAFVALPRWVYPDFRVPVLPENTPLIQVPGSIAHPISSPHDSGGTVSLVDRPVIGDARLWLVAGVLSVVWLAGVIPSLTRVAWGWARLKRVRLRGTAWRLPRQTSQYLKRKYRLRRLPQVVLTGQIQNALTVGIFHPQILLQRHLVHELSRGQLRDGLDHEMAHVIRRDCLVMFLEQVARACHWCNPCLQWLCNELARSREQLCDNTVLTQRPPIAYGETLLRVAELSLSGGTYRQVLAMLARWSDLRWRMQAILDPRQQRSATVGIPSAATMCVGLLFCGWLMGGVTFTTESFDRFHPTMYPQRSHFHANLVAATR